MAIDYDKLLALKNPAVEQTYSAKDCILYALGVGLGLNPMNEDELPPLTLPDVKIVGGEVSWRACVYRKTTSNNNFDFARQNSLLLCQNSLFR